MLNSRLRRYEENRLKKRFILTLLGSIGVLAFLVIFGLKILVGFSLFVDKLKGNTPSAKPTPTLILPPTLNPLPEATNSAAISVSGSGQAGLTLILYLNGSEYKKLAIPPDGNFNVDKIETHEGTNTVSAKLADDKGTISDLSNVVSVNIKLTAPELAVTAPADGTTVNGDQNNVNVTGSVKDDSVNVSINGRLTVVNKDGSFKYALLLNNGSNILEIKATDAAGNQTTITRHVNYER